ncbi:hypothetical protein HD_0043 [[Haemophilus] ducreyi 35000HP]|uniref:Uncharacterized protein n=1 Tax=Haemophilus ducreyi (strain 35000HP / ATCC 700724) TaxID=233412 RepID=Q7VPL9_HAEDU|nr:hypothetical protein HD_0043 [[Haemophilus] ducreyi 35000HP]
MPWQFVSRFSHLFTLIHSLKTYYILVQLAWLVILGIESQ